jgi:hypothetical protein
MEMAMSILIVAALQAAAPPHRPPDLFDQLEGEWVCRQEMLASGPVWRTEIWWSQEDDSVAGRILIAQRRPPSGEAMHPDFTLHFSRTGRTPRLTWRPAEGRPVSYRLARNSRQEMVFERVGNGSPRVIAYRIDGTRLEVMHGLAEGGTRRWSYQRQGDHRPAVNCDGRR